MADKKLTVVISQSQGKNRVKRQLEEELAAVLILEPDIDVSLVPHLNDLHADHTGLLFLRSVPGNLVVLAWLYPRAARWMLDRQGVKGQAGTSLLIDEQEADEEEEPRDQDPAEPQGVGALDVPNRKIYCIDLSVDSDPQIFVDELRRIAQESSVQTVDLMQWIQGRPQAAQLERYLHPEQTIAAGNNGNGSAGNDTPEPVKRRWYPVIDYDRCTNCMECIDFCLFGVYGVDQVDRILVEEQDSCKKGCPACSRVCPENAIIFPGHKTPAIAGADGEVAGLKIDLSQLFGAPSKSALDLAVEERDTELVRDGRDAVGMSAGIPKRHSSTETKERDDLDELIDGLDELDL